MDDKNTEEFEAGGKSSISADLIRGHINTIILRSLYDRDKYGYEIINEINEKSHGQYTLKQPTLYSALKRLETQGYIQAYWKTDEVSAGGRRKYFRLTDSGREITEHNQAEWEYSRTVIDNLISDRNFDFNQPAPTPVDFKLLKQATTRVPVIHGEGEGEEESKENNSAPAGMPIAEIQTYVAQEDKTVFIDDPEKSENKQKKEDNSEDIIYSASTEKPLTYSEELFQSGTTPALSESAQDTKAEKSQQTAEEIKTQGDSVETTRSADSESAESSTVREMQSGQQTNAESVFVRETTAEQASGNYPGKEYSEDTHTESRINEIERRTDEYTYLNEEPARNTSTVRNSYTSQLGRSAEEEARRKVHENYLKLISGDEDKKRDNGETPYAETVDTDKLIYNSRPEQERDYKNLIDKLFDNTLKNTEPAVITPAPAPEPQQVAQPQQQPAAEPVNEQIRQNVRYNYFDANSKAASDGLKISTSDEAFAAGAARQTTYNKGATLFKCALIIGVIMLLEFTLTLLFRQELAVSVAYPIVILALGLALVLVCGILFGARYGNHMRKPTSLRYITTACIITVLLICIIFIFSIILQVNWSSATDVMAKVVIPCIIALNIPIFTLSFYLFTK